MSAKDPADNINPTEHDQTIRAHVHNIRRDHIDPVSMRKLPQAYHTHEAHEIAANQLAAEFAPKLGLNPEDFKPITATTWTKIVGAEEGPVQMQAERHAINVLKKIFELARDGACADPDKAQAVAVLGKIATDKLSERLGMRELNASVKKIGDENVKNGFHRGY